MRERPAGVTDDQIAADVADGWALEVTSAAYLPLGFGAHHWRVETSQGARFVTLDVTTRARGPASFEAAYASALAAGLDVVVASLPRPSGAFTLQREGGVLSCTPWVTGEVVGDDGFADEAEARTTADALRRLHAAPVPPTLGRWTTKVAPDLVDDLTVRSEVPWEGGPHGESARRAVRAGLRAVDGWAREHARLLAVATRRPWVVTHGETHTRNQLRTPERTVLVDWESVALAPRERDLGGLVAYGWPGLDADPDMLELFDLEWRLDEIGQYAAWLAGPHRGSADDLIALEGLRSELQR